MTQRIDITGQRFNWLTVVKHQAGTKWLCVCDCGTQKVVESLTLRQGKTKSCGCKRPELISANLTTHGMTNTPTYRSWISMRRRCYDKTHPQFRYYGGKGITVCKRWKDSFENFMSDMGERPDGKTIDRVDSKKNYTPTNCRWATQAEQMANTSRSAKYQGKSLKEWSNETGIKYATLCYRLRTHGTIFI
jgi:hypothetical protein